MKNFYGTKTFISLLTGLLIVVAVLVTVFIQQVCIEWSQSMTDFHSLWDVTQVLQQHVLKKGKWPADWDALRRPLNKFESHVDDYASEVKQQVDVNFDIDPHSSVKNHKWYVRLRSGRLKGEVNAANLRVRGMLEEIQRERRSGSQKE